MSPSSLALLRQVRARPIVKRDTPPRRSDRNRLGDILVARGALDPGDLVKALALQAREDVRLGDILLTHGMVAEADLLEALSEQWSARIVDLIAEPPDPRLIDQVGPEVCLREQFVPWRRIGGATVVATSRPAEFERRRPELAARFGNTIMAIAPERDLLAALLALRSSRLVQRAETLAPDTESCRSWDGRRFRRWLAGGLGVLAAGMSVAPAATFGMLTAVALVALAANTALRVGALSTGAWRSLREARKAQAPSRATSIARLPVVSVLVPLYKETAIADRLVMRLTRLSYPRELLDICLVTEDNDDTTRSTLAAARLPRWFRVVTVPEGTLRTKPRAMNYALEFCRGSIIGVYDAEDAPAPDQIHRVVQRFHERGPETVCLQGMLDYYNARRNWMARCFAVEYAAWFRVVLPGIERMGLAIPLGGTTLFFRRSALEKLGGWDAHNVTEDADLGIRLARHGMRAEILDTVTEEEANARPWPWVRQRSRWIKGYAMTWAVHMRDPARLRRDLGLRKFLGVQVLFGGTLAQFLLAPVLWSYGLLFFGLPHPMAGVLTGAGALALGVVFLLAFVVNVVVMVTAVSGPRHRHLIPWVFTLGFYFPLATLAAVKAIAEMLAQPFYWDKTQHGEDTAEPDDHDAAPEPGLKRLPHADGRRPVLADPIDSGRITPTRPETVRLS